MLAFTEPGVRKISAMVATQLLKSTLIENIMGYHAHLDPCPMLIVQPKDTAALQFSKERVAPFIKATPALRGLIGSSKTRAAGDTVDYKAFPGGFLGIVGAGSPDNLARRPIRIILFDEVDKYLPLKEGDPLLIGAERLATFESNSLDVAVCSPTITGESKIEARYSQSDQRRASVSCPDCGHRQFLDFFKHIHWDRGADGKTHKPETARIYCEACGVGWSEGQRLRALGTIRWHQTRNFECCGDLQNPLEAYSASYDIDAANGVSAVDRVWDWWASNRHAVYRAKCRHCSAWAVPNEHAGFQASKLYSPWANDAPPKMAAKWLAAVDEDGKLTFYNTQLALTYRKNTGKQIDGDTLLARREIWDAVVPDGVAKITAGVDVQDYRVEIEIVGWGRDEESWSIDHEVIDGEFSSPETRAALDAYLQRKWQRADGRIFAIGAACIDSGGHHTTAVYDFSKANLGRQIWAIKGESAQTGQRNPVWPTKRPSTRSKKTYRPTVIGVNAAKDTILLSYLPREKSGPGYMHFNVDRDAGYFAQLTAERIEIKERGGHRYRVWTLPTGRANEALDLRVYAYAALHGLMHRGFKLNREAERVNGSPRGEPDTADVTAAAEASGPSDGDTEPASEQSTTPRHRARTDRQRIGRRLA
ncbi:phage terminase large subunit GpA-like protein [Sphingomonas vulcanisoli]|uniref:Phage terminase large subunit GpA-like protein n=2 Tax=Sphingomonas vulcanisoli TaxID=1658060 RepID=A0ABX0TNX1_9SPHN|nr:phage terminase large subunit GpA-like protein [Sphingomonas vulcanisoli]